ncbi:unnamed protein product [Ilex paraguariensis]|uniref:Uncharacterized protein n=1 Tax=Ilex paraguariensis TaxID=185542 RepID=A0ABC8RZZ0_9AQUA
MELLCTDHIYNSGSRSLFTHIRFVASSSYSRAAIRPKKKLFRTSKSLKISSFAASVNSSSKRRIEAEALELPKPSTSTALEQLDIERGVCVPFRKYTPESVRNKVLESRGAILSLLGRGVEIVWNLGLYWSALMYDCLVGRDYEVVPFRARQLRNLLCDLGSSFIKAGQVLANRPDIIREDYMNELCILQDDVPPFPNQVLTTE